MFLKFQKDLVQISVFIYRTQKYREIVLIPDWNTEKSKLMIHRQKNVNAKGRAKNFSTHKLQRRILELKRMKRNFRTQHRVY